MHDRAHRLTARRPPVAVLSLLLTILIALPGCGEDSEEGAGSDEASQPNLTIGAIPDQDPQEPPRLYGTVADYLARRLGC